jgi:hypothetical protein
MAGTRPAMPSGLGDRGRRFWRAVLGIYELSRAEVELLAEVCRVLDELDELRALIAEDGMSVHGSTGQRRLHPAVSEIRQRRALLGRLLSQLQLPDPETGQTPQTPAQARARKAARARWDWHERRRREGTDGAPA